MEEEVWRAAGVQEHDGCIPVDAPLVHRVSQRGPRFPRINRIDITDAHVAVCARAARQVVITSDAADIARLAPELTTIRV